MTKQSVLLEGGGREEVDVLEGLRVRGDDVFWSKMSTEGDVLIHKYGPRCGAPLGW